MRRAVTPSLLLLALLALVPSHASAQTASRPAPAPAAPAPLHALAPAPMMLVHGLLAFIDPETGLIGGPISSLLAPMDLGQTAAAGEPVEVRLPDGSYMLDLQGTGMEYLTLHVDALGKRTLRCVHGAAHAHASLSVVPVPPAPVER